MSVQATARVETAMPARYLAQLCKHFGHRMPATHDATQGRIEFPDGLCELTTGESSLQLRITAADAAAVERLEDVVARHLQRFAFREALQMNWERA
jgi:hypothetical protein